MRYRCCIFDFAGTLVDLRPAFIEATLAAVAQWAPGKLSREDLTAQLSGPVADPFVGLAEGRESLANEMRHVFLQHLEAHRQEFIVPFPGVVEMLAALGKLGVRAAVISGSARATGSEELEASGIAPYVHTVVFQDDVSRPKPFADVVVRALSVSGASADEALLIGDSNLDVQCGRLAGVRTGAALWGALDEAALLAEKPDVTFARPADVADFLAKPNP